MSTQQRFTFVNVSDPQETQTEGNKKRIRSAAAASGWAQGGRPKIKLKSPQASPTSTQFPDSQDSISEAERNDSHNDPVSGLQRTDSATFEPENIPDLVGLQPRKYLWEFKPRRKSVRARPKANLEDSDRHAANVKRKRIARARASIDQSQPQTQTPSLSSGSTISTPSTLPSTWSSTLHTPEAGVFSPLGGILNLYDLGSGSGDAFGCYPIPTKPWLDQILHHMLTVFAPRGWPALGITHEQGLSWERFMTQHALAEPALFNVRLLFASGDLIRMKVLAPETSLWLQHQAVKSINEALNDPNRAVSDGIILAVGRIALNESLYGDRNAANLIHRPAQHRMIMMRGGMGALEFPDLVKRLMRWADRVMSMQSDTPRFLPDDDESFSLGQSVDVLEKWVPQQGQFLRQKVTPRD